MKDTILVSVSNLMANGTTFILMMIAAKTLTITEFSNLSLAVSVCFMLTTVLDFGVNLTLVRSFGINKNSEILDGAMSLKWLTFASVLPFCVAGLILSQNYGYHLSIVAWGLLGAAVLNLWMGTRAIEQAHQNFYTYAKNNLSYAAIRLLLGGAALWLVDNVDVFFFTAFVLPGLVFVVVQVLKGTAYQISDSSFKAMLIGGRGYSALVFLSSVAYGAILYIPQFVVAHRLSATSVSSYGISLSFLGVVALIANSVRSVLLPRLVGGNPKDAIRRLVLKLKKLLPLYLAMSAVILSVGARSINYWYGELMPDAHYVFLICGSGLLGTVYVGFFNVSIHAIGRPALEALSNVCRLIVLIPALWVWGNSLLGIAATFAVVLFLGEISTSTLIALRVRKLGIYKPGT
jgi:O-antigen/teichoic acid export membrane protein